MSSSIIKKKRSRSDDVRQNESRDVKTNQDTITEMRYRTTNKNFKTRVGLRENKSCTIRRILRLKKVVVQWSP